MAVFRWPLSGNVSQTINPWTWWFNPVGSQVGLVNIELGPSSNPAVEEEVLREVASYGKQLGKIEDALAVLLDHFRREHTLSKSEEAVLDSFAELVSQIATVKAKHPKTAGS